MEQVFPMEGPPPSPDIVDRHLAINNEILKGVAAVLTSRLDDQLTVNQRDIDLVKGRMQRSINGMLSKTSGPLQPVVQALQGVVDTALGANQAILDNLPASVKTAAVAAPKVMPGPFGSWGVVTNGRECAVLAAGQELGQYVDWTIQVYGQSQQQAQFIASQCGGANTQPPVPVLRWYCVLSPGAGPVSVQWDDATFNANMAMSQTSGARIFGPYPDKVSADLACHPNSPPPPEPPPPPPPPPPPEPPPEPPPPEPKYYCLAIAAADGSTALQVVTEPDVPRLVAAGWHVQSGPYGDFDTAASACAKPVTPPDSVESCPPGTLPVFPNWCSVNVADTIDAISGAVDGKKRFDLFESLNAGTQTAIAPSGTWLATIGNYGVLGKTLYDFIVTAFCRLNNTVNAAIADNVQPKEGLLPVAIVYGVLDTLASKIGLGLGDTRDKFGYWMNYLSPTHIPSVGEADALYQQGFINRQQWYCWTRSNNVCEQPHEMVVSAGMYHPDAHTTERLYRAGDIGADEYNKLMRWNKIQDDYTLGLHTSAYVQYPGMGDVIRFMVRDVFDPAVVASAKLSDEFEEKWTEQARRYGSIAGVTDELAELNWRAHWQLPSISQTYEMMRRLRPGRVDIGLQFTRADALQLLGVNDMAPGYRDRLIEVSYNPLPIRALRTLYDTHQIDTREVGERYQDMGYSPADSGLFSAQEEILRTRRVASQAQGWTPHAIFAAASANAMSEAEIQFRMGKLGYDNTAAADLIDRARKTRTVAFALSGERKAMARALQVTLKAYQVGSIDRAQAEAVLSAQGFAPASTTVILNAGDVASRSSLATAVVTAIRKATLRGEVSPQQAENQLVAAGIASPRATEYVAAWTLQLSPQRKMLSANQVLKLVREGLISAVQARQRLNNLGFAADDTELLIAETAYQSQQAEFRAKTAIDKQRQKTSAALLRESQRLQASSEKLRVQICKHTPPGTLVRWYAFRYIDDQYVRDSLTCQGYTPDQIEGTLHEARDKRAARDEAKAKKEAKASATTNGEAGGGSSAEGASSSG